MRGRVGTQEAERAGGPPLECAQAASPAPGPQGHVRVSGAGPLHPEWGLAREKLGNSGD